MFIISKLNEEQNFGHFYNSSVFSKHKPDQGWKQLYSQAFEGMQEAHQGFVDNKRTPID